MGRETTKAKHRRELAGFFDRYCKGLGLDIGCGPDPLTPTVDQWDLPQVDAQYLKGIVDDKYDFVYSSHCLEHMVDPVVAIKHWYRVVKPFGFLIIEVPDEDLYEQGVFPSRFNSDHKWTFTISKQSSWSPRSVNVTDILKTLPDHKVHYIKTVDTRYNYSIGNNTDQTAMLDAEASIEFVVQKITPGAGVVKLR